jgi:hypothetical protein
MAWEIQNPVNFTENGDETNVAISKFMSEFGHVYSLLRRVRSFDVGSLPPADPEEGSVWFNSHDNKFMMYTSGTWTSVLDQVYMSISSYDTNGDGKVNAADAADVANTADSVTWAGVTGKPSTYPPDNHTHSQYVLTTDYENADVLAKVKAVDGAGSGLDADLLDGKHLSEIGGGMKHQIFTSSGTFTVPSGVTSVLVTLIGGGGGGSKGRGTDAPGSGGGSGGVYYRTPVTVTSGSSISVTIGAGGAGGAGTTYNGSAGGTSSFGTYLSATGGAGGVNNGAWATYGGAPGSPATAYYTQKGSVGSQESYLDQLGGGGGGTILGSASPMNYSKNGRLDGLAFGGGGSGGGFRSDGGHGAPGVCIVEWEE